jgi:tetratricopeptide (TPR) repeat protein
MTLSIIEMLTSRWRASVLLHRGNKAYQRGENVEAAALYREALVLRPDIAVTLFNLGLALYKNGERRAAREQWERVLELTEDRNPYLHEQAEIMLRQFS